MTYFHDVQSLPEPIRTKVQGYVDAAQDRAICYNGYTNCQTLCQGCQDAATKYVRDTILKSINDSLSVLESWGFKMDVPSERKVLPFPQKVR